MSAAVYPTFEGQWYGEEGKYASRHARVQVLRHPRANVADRVANGFLLGCNVIFLCATTLQQTLFVGVVKSGHGGDRSVAHLRSPERRHPTTPWTKMGLKHDDSLRVRKAAFGDVRGPRQWHVTALNYMKKAPGLYYTPPLGAAFAFLPARRSTRGRCFRFFEVNLCAPQLVHGVMGLHVGDFSGWVKRSATRTKVCAASTRTRVASRRDSLQSPMGCFLASGTA